MASSIKESNIPKPTNSLKAPKSPRSFRGAVREMWVPYSQLVPFLKPYRARVIFGLVCGALAGMMSGALGAVIKNVSDSVFKGSGMSKAAVLHGTHIAGPGVETVIWKCLLI